MPSSKNIEAVAELSDKLVRAKAIYFTDYLGLDVGSITDLRSQFFQADVEYTVAKNTLLKIAAKQNKIKGLDEFLTGPTAIAISYDEPTSPAKVIKSFAKVHDKPRVKGILFEGDVLDGSEFKRLADLPSKIELLSQLVAMLQSSMSKLVNTLNAPLTNVANVLNNLKEQKT
ncbi:MAG TPA: 50S ribosomal protein L10 [Candidatus Marinimicrobia bacterium]|jgi:large subunit ribosomal protein L10|nr:MAG: 50S ribosomal protein L10 [Candidatus Neomarinimicrobiota bacterium]HIM74222.1 50S ribosomal protein L10 [Candidatus Neomarinimicrobiota bacterium]